MLGRKIASHEGYEYSDALKAKGGDDWDYEKINHMIENPNAFAPGTKMALFPGLPDAKQRADVLAVPAHQERQSPASARGYSRAADGGAAEGAAPGRACRAARRPAADSSRCSPRPTRSRAKPTLALCKVCHNFDKGGGTLIGPDLYGVVGRKIASVEGFNYTPALKAHEGDWTYENLDAWLTNPQAFAPGTAMAFPGIADDQEARRRHRLPAQRMPRARCRCRKLRGNTRRTSQPRQRPPAAEAPAAPSAEEPQRLRRKPRQRQSPQRRQRLPAAETPAPAAETPAAATSTEEPPAAEEPSAETPAAPETPAPSAETPAAPARSPPPSEPSLGEPPSPAQPQPVYPEAMRRSVEETGGQIAGASQSSMGEPPSPSQPQPVYPDGPPRGVE